MLLKDVFNNIIQDVRVHLIKYAYLYAPLLGLSVYLLIKKTAGISINDEFISNMINVSGVLSGFLFTTLGIIISLPSNNFTEFIKETGYMRIIYKAMISGILSLLISMMLGLFNVNKSYTIYIFIIGISETFLSAYYLYRVSYFSGKSK